MNISTLLPALVTLHLIGLILMAGTTFIDYIAFKTFWKQFETDREKSLGLLDATAKFSRLIGIGAALLIITGVGMMGITHGVFGEQLWFRIKFGLVVLLIVNGLLNGRRQGLKLRAIVAENSPGIMLLVNRVKASLNRFHLIQLVIFLVIVFLSVFKFS